LREEKIALRAFTICIPHVWGDQAGWGGRGILQAWSKVEASTVFWWRNARERHHLEDLGCMGLWY
jgi:hypothetical protein